MTLVIPVTFPEESLESLNPAYFLTSTHLSNHLACQFLQISDCFLAQYPPDSSAGMVWGQRISNACQPFNNHFCWSILAPF